MKKAARYISWVLVAASVVFIGYTMARMDLRPVLGLMKPLWIVYLAGMTVIYAFLSVIRGVNWALILSLLDGSAPRYLSSQAIYLRTEIAKYIPSNVMHFAGRHLLAKKLGYSNSVLVLSNVLDMGLLLFTAALIIAVSLFSGNITLPAAIYDMISYKKLGIMAGAGVAVFLGVFILKFRSLGKKYRMYLRAKSLVLLILVVLLFLPVFIISSGILCSIIGPLLGSSLTLTQAGLIFAGFSFSWTIGFIVPGAPGGLGIRETVMIILFTPVFGAEVSLAAAVLLRVVSIAGDGLSFAISYIPLYRRHIPALD